MFWNLQQIPAIRFCRQCLQNPDTQVIQMQLSNDWQEDCLPSCLTKPVANHLRTSNPMIGLGLVCILTRGHAW